MTNHHPNARHHSFTAPGRAGPRAGPHLRHGDPRPSARCQVQEGRRCPEHYGWLERDGLAQQHQQAFPAGERPALENRARRRPLPTPSAPGIHPLSGFPFPPLQSEVGRPRAPISAREEDLDQIFGAKNKKDVRNAQRFCLLNSETIPLHPHLLTTNIFSQSCRRAARPASSSPGQRKTTAGHPRRTRCFPRWAHNDDCHRHGFPPITSPLLLENSHVSPTFTSLQGTCGHAKVIQQCIRQPGARPEKRKSRHPWRRPRR